MSADQARAARLWPDNPTLQAKWLQAVALVRSTARGWLLDNPKRVEQSHA